MGETLALPRRAVCLQTIGWIKQVHSYWLRGLSTVPWELFGLNVEISGRLLRRGSSCIRTSRKLGRREGLGRAHRFGSYWGQGPRLSLCHHS